MTEEVFDTKNWVVGVLRRASYRTQMYSEVRKAAKIPVPPGYPNKRLKFLQKCALCQQGFPMKETQVDHIVPVVSDHYGWTSIEQGLLVGKPDFNPVIYALLEGKLQVVCKVCHKKKSKRENALRHLITKMYDFYLTKAPSEKWLAEGTGSLVELFRKFYDLPKPKKVRKKK